MLHLNPLNGKWETCVPSFFVDENNHEHTVPCILQYHADVPEGEISDSLLWEFYAQTELDRQPDKIWKDGTKVWTTGPRSRKHRAYDLPAIIHPNGDKEYYQRGVRHREDGKPAVVRRNGEVEYWVKGNMIIAENKNE